jgi:hypothetical protein
MSPAHEALRRCLAQAVVRAWRLHLETPTVEATVPMLRGVWGAALHDRQPELYRSLFEGGAGGTPGYVLRPAPREAEPAPALEMILFGPAGTEAEARLWASWEGALGKGLGPRRAPARLAEVRPMAWDGTALSPGRRQPGFALYPLPWPGGDPAGACWLRFSAPLRLMRNGRLTLQPSLADLAMAALRRLHALFHAQAEPVWAERQEWLRLAWTVPCAPWQGGPLDLVRYSGSQKGEIELRGVAGGLFLPEGPGPLTELLAAAGWLHLGKGTVMGLGQLEAALANS